ncbi:MAG: non-heme iron oxygenase ferredoxin subunit [Chloroflexi bacterium]|nr:non-heme iron oxygenase ferredoxin subunit [Chloroflexota bacterium]
MDAGEIEFIAVGGVEEIPNGGRIFLSIDEHNIVVFNIAGKLFAIADLCSHDDGPLGEGELEDEYEISCPRHGAHFDVRTGKAVKLPAVVDIPAYPVRVIGTTVEIGLPAK